jgi:hypothetical protein
MKNATPQQIAAAFSEWERRFREEPEKFMTAEQKADGSLECYGEVCSRYFLKILAAVRRRRPEKA